MSEEVVTMIRRFWRHGFLAVLLLVLAGCASYSVTEAELNQQLAERAGQNRVLDISHQQNRIRLEMKLFNLQLKLLEARGGVAQVTLDSGIKGWASVFGQELKLSSELKPQLETGLRYDEGAIYLVDPRVTQLGFQNQQLNQALMQPLLMVLQPQLEMALSSYFSRYPVYQLGDSMQERIAARAFRGIEIRDGKLEFKVH